MESVTFKTSTNVDIKNFKTGISVNLTNDYDRFKIIEGNRPPNPKHLNRLYNSILENGLLCNPIIVNANYEIIDGQHRFFASKKANISFFYIMVDDYGLKDVHTLNLNQKNWTKKDFMDGYAEMGSEAYIKLRDFVTKNPGFTFHDCISFCSNVSSSNSSSFTSKHRNENGNVSKLSEVFEEGTWKGKDFELAQEWADKISQLKDYFTGYNKSVFVGTMIIILQNESFNFNEFVNKVKIQPKALYDCANREQCKLMIENVYNYKRREKVSLRY